MSSKKISPPVRIEWQDSCSPRRWTDKLSLQGYKPASIVSIGWIIDESPKSITIASHIGLHEVDGVLCIPKSVITKRTKLK